MLASADWWLEIVSVGDIRCSLSVLVILFLLL